MHQRFVYAGIALVVTTTVLWAQPPARPQPSNRSGPSEDEIVSALQDPDINDDKTAMLDGVAMRPAHSLQDSTIDVMSRKVLELDRQIDAQFQADPLSRHEGDADAVMMEALIEVLKAQKNPVAIETLASLVPYFGVTPTLVAFGEKAVPALIRRARCPEGSYEPGFIDGALAALEQMLEQPAIRSTLSPTSRNAIRQLASDRMKDLGRPDTAYSTFAHAAYLAVATGDPQLRKQVTDVVSDGVELRRRGIVDIDQQEWIKKRIGEALEKHFDRP
jgi:hypothetical protein